MISNNDKANMNTTTNKDTGKEHEIVLERVDIKEIEKYGLIILRLVIDGHDTHRRLLFKVKDDRLHFIDIASDHFALLPNALVKEIIDEIATKMNLTLHKQWYIGKADEFQYLWYVDKSNPLHLAGDEHYIGIMVRSAENIRSTIQVYGLLIRKICDNGLAIPYGSSRIIRYASRSLYRDLLTNKLETAVRSALVASKTTAKYIDLSRQIPLTAEMIIKLRRNLPMGGAPLYKGSLITWRILKNDFVIKDIHDDTNIYVFPDRSLYDLYCRITEYATHFAASRLYAFERITTRLCKLIIDATKVTDRQNK